MFVVFVWAFDLQIAMSDTELAMREKEEEYARAIEEDRLRREERRARKKEMVLELARTRAAVGRHIS